MGERVGMSQTPSAAPAGEWRCDYRRPECVNDGVTVDGVWRCRNHLNAAPEPERDPAAGGREAASDESLFVALEHELVKCHEVSSDTPLLVSQGAMARLLELAQREAADSRERAARAIGCGLDEVDENPALALLTALIYEGRGHAAVGPLMFCESVDGRPGLWLASDNPDEDTPALAYGDTATELLLDLARKAAAAPAPQAAEPSGVEAPHDDVTLVADALEAYGDACRERDEHITAERCYRLQDMLLNHTQVATNGR